MEQDKHSPDQNTEEKQSTTIVCKNCETIFDGTYCPQCGQHIKELERPIRFMFVDFMGTVVSFDTRLIKTLVAILFKPGKLTQDFLDGKRARYMPPFRFYVFISFVMFLLVSTITNSSIKENNFTVFGDDNDNAMVKIDRDSAQVIKDSVMNVVDHELKNNLDSAEYATYKKNSMTVDSIPDKMDDFMQGIEDAVEGDDDSKYAATTKLIKEHPELYMNKLFQFTSWSLFLFMPLFAFFLWISFLRSKKLYIGHLIFGLNIHSYIFTITSLVIAVALIFPNHDTTWMGYLFWTLPIYQVIGARRLYKRKWVSTFFKMTLVWFMYGFVWLIGLVTLLVFSFIGM
ncbi:DUF3667 domain-containing protein [Carboxylicivirga sp. N1Y90]|uniref:DUF3667 domain-containing protein n=1 Tax=Carboxylicivirga fragile TaxID=3417571 RepID=UPI003D3315ED|nr:DUF3667 domain-containing protein [Marinilabiliaceae bacterium N1Y90]